MKSKITKYLLSTIIGVTFLWLAFRTVDISAVWNYTQEMTWGWIPPFIFITAIAHFFRAERWRLLIERDNIKVGRSTLYGGVLFGYLMNYIIPRLGEVSRCVYVSKKEKHSVAELIGTVVLERIVDLLFLILFIAFLFFYMMNDMDLLRSLFGTGNIDYILSLYSWKSLLLLLLFSGVLFLLYKVGISFLSKMSNGDKWYNQYFLKLHKYLTIFITGLISITRMKQWGYFMVLSLGIWFSYILMAYIPLHMFDMVSRFDISILDSAILTVISAIGVTLPSPGAIGTYHWFTKQALVVLFNVDEVTALAFAFVTHAFMLLVVVFITPVTIAVNNFLLKKK